MAVNLATKYSDKVDEVFRLGALTTSMAGGKYEFTGAQTVKVYSMGTAEMNDYKATGSNRYGNPEELEDTTEELTLTQKRSFTFTIDATNAVDSPAGITDDSQDGLITALLSDAEDSVRDYIGREEVPARLISVQVQLAVIAYNKRGAEGESSRSEGGISQSFDGLPPELLARLKNYPRKVGLLYTADTEQT